MKLSPVIGSHAAPVDPTVLGAAAVAAPPGCAGPCAGKTHQGPSAPELCTSQAPSSASPCHATLMAPVRGSRQCVYGGEGGRGTNDLIGGPAAVSPRRLDEPQQPLSLRPRRQPPPGEAVHHRHTPPQRAQHTVPREAPPQRPAAAAHRIRCRRGRAGQAAACLWGWLDQQACRSLCTATRQQASFKPPRSPGCLSSTGTRAGRRSQQQHGTNRNTETYKERARRQARRTGEVEGSVHLQRQLLTRKRQVDAVFPPLQGGPGRPPGRQRSAAEPGSHKLQRPGWVAGAAGGAARPSPAPLPCTGRQASWAARRPES